MNGNFPQKGDVYWVALDPTIGSETQKTRPCLVISNDEGNSVSKLIIIAPITSKVKTIYPFEVATCVAGKKAKIMLNQCRCVDKLRLKKMECHLTAETMNEVDEAIKVVFGL